MTKELCKMQISQSLVLERKSTIPFMPNLRPHLFWTIDEGQMSQLDIFWDFLAQKKRE